MAFEIGEKIEVTCKENKEKYVGTLTRICLGINEEQYPTLASIVLKDDVLPNETYGNVHLFCKNIAKIKRYQEREVVRK